MLLARQRGRGRVQQKQAHPPPAHPYVTQNGKVVRETIGTGTTEKVLDFIYDNSGKPFALTYTDGTAEPQRYYYVLNLQGDVVALMTADRTIVARYAYNAWGKLLSVTDEDGEAITSASHIANLNPIRYRGYYYDTETGFYYLQSRYYDPANHRFINADSYTSTGQGFLGCNMFAYCNNNPVNGIDPTGKVVSMIEFGNEALLYEGSTSPKVVIRIPPPSLGVGEAVTAAWNGIKSTANKVYNYFANEDIQNVKEAGFIAFYKGKPVIKTSFLGNFSYGIIFLKNGSWNEDTLRHEYGHCVHMDQIGIGTFTAMVAIPSLIGYWTEVEYYYSQPWEYIANAIGDAGCSEEYLPNANAHAEVYWWLTVLLP